MKVPAEALGKTATCVKCGERLRITVDSTDPSLPSSTLPPRAPGSKPAQDSSSSAGSDVVHVLRQHGLVDALAIEQATLVQRDLPKKMWDLLIDLGYVTPEDFHSIMAKQKGIANIDLQNYRIPKEVVEIVSPEIAHRGILMPVDKLGKLLTLAMACPLDVDSIVEVEAHTGLKVKPMLGTIDALKTALANHYPLEAVNVTSEDPVVQELHKEFGKLLEANEVARRVFAIDSLAPCVDTMERLKLASNGQHNGSTLKTITEIIATDPVATALLLRVSNSEAYGFSKHVDGLGLACTLLGPSAACEIVDSVDSAGDRDKIADFDYDAFWKRAQFCSEAAQSIAGAMNSQLAITAYTAALLHEIGRLALLSAMPNSYARVTKDKAGPERTVAEGRAFHLTAAEAGYILTRKWNMPLSITEPIRFQREPRQAKQTKEITPIVTLAVLMADAFEIGAATPNFNKVDAVIVKLGLSRSTLEDIYEETSTSLSA